MDIRIAGVAIVAIALLAAGCDEKTSTPTPTSKAPTSAAPAAKDSDELQIRELLTQEGAAFTDWDFAKVGELTCPQFREQAMSSDAAIPPMSMFPASAAASLGPQGFADQLAAQFTGASNDSLLAVSNAVIRQDEPAYKTAMLDVVKQSMSIHLLQVDNIVVKGDTATADVLLTQRLGNQPADTKSTPATLVRIDGKWLDCTPPAKQ